MSAWAASAAITHQAFADPEPIIYVQGGVVRQPVTAVRSDLPAPSFDGPGNTLRTVSYEIRQADLPSRPVNGDVLRHRGRSWRVIDVSTLDDVAAWSVVVTDAGAAA